MEKSQTQKLAEILKILVAVTFVCNLLALPLVPGVVGMGTEYGLKGAVEEFALFGPEFGPLIFLAICWQYLFRVWRSEYAAVLTLFLWACGTCTAVILWQARRVLDTVIEGLPFQRRNARSMMVAAVSCALIALAALLRLIWGFFYYGSAAPLFTYNALFVPVFAMAGLLCLVMSALFLQAAVLKEDSDLVI